MTFNLVAADWRATLLPDLGGAIGSLAFKGHEILRPTPAGASDVLQTACFPLVPYANRIAHGRFTFDGAVIQLPVPARFAPHAIHGIGWQRAWEVVQAGPDRAILQLHAGGDESWPWRFSARQTVALTARGLKLILSVRNENVVPMPAGLGLHPYFPLETGASLQFAARQVWLGDDSLLPVETASPDAVQDFAGGAALPEGRLIDHCYAGWDGLAVLHAGGRTISVRASTNHVHIYVPPEGQFCCIEPVTHRPDAVNAGNSASGMAALAPGAELAFDMEISVSGASAR